MSEQEAIMLAQHGNEAAFLYLYERYTKRLYGFIVSRVVDARDAEELVATIWEKIITHLKDFEQKFEHSFSTWIFTIARNTLYNFYKSSAYHKTSSLETVENSITGLDQQIDNPPDPFDQKRMTAYVQQLPNQQSEVIKLKYFSDLKNKEIASYLGVSEKTVASNLSRALKKLSQMMQ